MSKTNVAENKSGAQYYENVERADIKNIPVLIVEWNHLKESITSIRGSINWYNTAGSFLMGTGVTAFFAGYCYPSNGGASEMPHEAIFCYSAGVAAFAMGITCLSFAWKQRQTFGVSVRWIISFMNVIEKRYKLDNN